MFYNLTSNQKQAIQELENRINFKIDDSLKITVNKSNSTSIIKKGNDVLISYKDDNEFFVTLKTLKSKIKTDAFSLILNKKIEEFTTMFDCSRNSVMNLNAIKRYICILALSGYTGLMLYTEDTYEVDNEKYFGYLRGKYTKNEITEIVNYAEAFGIKVIPCIQTLAHLNAIFRWEDYKSINDCEDILLVNNDRTYTLIENMIKTVSECFKSKRILIGMDEAHLLGSGKYLFENGYKKRYEIMKEHLNIVVAICEKYGLKAFMWDDMFYRILHNEKYYPPKEEFNEKGLIEITKDLPKNLGLIYWDYFNVYENYLANIDYHKVPNRELWFACSTFTSRRLTAENSLAFEKTIPALNACIIKGIKHFLVTLWGDNGGETSFFTSLPSLIKLSSINYEESETEFKDGFLAITNIQVDKFLTLDGPFNDRGFFFNDLFLGVYDTSIEKDDSIDYSKYYKSCKNASKNAEIYSYLYDLRCEYFKIMNVKYRLGIKTREAYKKGDKEELKKLIEIDYKFLRRELKKYYKYQKVQWFTDNKPYGFEVQDIRLGGMITRISDLIERLNEYIDGEVDLIPELEEELIVPKKSRTQIIQENIWYEEAVSVNKITR